MFTILPATADDIPVLRDLAQRIWHAHYSGIISREQIDYMLARMYAAEVIRSELAAGVAWNLARHAAWRRTQPPTCWCWRVGFALMRPTGCRPAGWIGH